MSSGFINLADGQGPVVLQPLEARLRVAASKGLTDEIEGLIKAGATFEADREGRTALHYSAQNGFLEACRILIRHGCSTDTQDILGYTPLHRCIAQGNLEISELLLKEGCQIDVQDQNGNTAMHEAAWNGYSKSLELLVKHNCSVHLPNKAGFTALHLASQAGHNESSRILLYAGCNPDGKNNYGDTALHTAARYGHAGVTRILISARCRLNEQNKNGDTALHITAALRRRKIAKLLVEAHIDINIKNKQNETAVDVAKRKEHPEIILIITSFSRPKTPRHGSRERETAPVQVAFKDEIEMIDGPVVVPEDHPPIKSEKPEEKKRSFFFFKRKKKDKNKEKEKPAPQEKPGPVDPRRRVDGFFSQYIPKPGVQYYRDLAGNIKQGPVGYSPACQCGPSLKRLESDMEKTKGNLCERIDASHQMLSQRIDHLDQRTAQQVYAIDKLTKERLEQERQACQNRITERIEEEWSGNKNVLMEYNKQIESWLDDRMASYGHCLDHHHDDSAIPSKNIFFDFHQNVNGRLFKSRSDETLSDCSGKNRKKSFYESRQAAMRQIRGWDVPDGTRRKERNGNHQTTSQSQVHSNRGNMDRKADGVSPKYEENANTTYHNFNYPGGARNNRGEGAIPKQPTYQKWQKPTEISSHQATIRSHDPSHFDSHRSISRLQTENRSSQKSNLAEGGVPNQRNNIGAGDSSLGTTCNGTGAHNYISNVQKRYDQNRNYQTSAYNSRPLSPNYRLAKSSDPLNVDMDQFPSGIARSKSVERTLGSPDRAEHCRSPQRKSVTFIDRAANKTPTPAECGDRRFSNHVTVNNGAHNHYNSISTFKPDIYASANEIQKKVNSDVHNSQPYGTVSSACEPMKQAEVQPYTRQYPASYNYRSENNIVNGDVRVNGAKSPVQHPSTFIPFDHSSPSQVVYNPSYVNKEDSTCSSNPDSGYSSKGIAHGNQSISCTPSSSFSADRSLSIGTPSNSNSPCLPNNPIEYNPPKSITNSTQSHSWYERKLLEAAEKMRKTNQYNEYDGNKSTYNELYVSLNYDPVHGSDV